MSRTRLFALSGLLLLSGCLWPVREKADETVLALASHPFDVAPVLPLEAARPTPPDKGSTPAAQGPKAEGPPTPATDLRTAALMQGDRPTGGPGDGKPKIDVTIPPAIPGSEAPRIDFTGLTPEQKAKAIRRLYPELPALPAEPTPLPGPGGCPYTLADLQQLAAANSPTLRQAAADVQAAKGNLIQAAAYPNPTFGYEADPSNNGATPGVQGFYIDQSIKTGGKLRLAAAAAEMDLRNAELALRRARSDLSTQVRNGYFGLLVAQETIRVTRELARFTEEIFRLQVGLQAGAIAAPYEPAALRAQTYITRLAYKQAISGYLYAWKQLVAAVGLRQLPLTRVAGRIDRFIPSYDYDAVLAHVLRHHTEVLTARNGAEKARYNLMLAQVTPIPDIDVRFLVAKEFALLPHTIVNTVNVGVPLPIWDQNKGNIIAAQGALERATEEPHRVEVTLTNTLAMAYTSYKNNLDALEYYRRNILPDQVRYYRGVFQRRQVDPAASFGDLVTAQQTLATDVTIYLTTLGSLWTAVVQVADLLQTDDLFQLAKPKEVPELPDLEALPPWLCHHPVPAPGPGAEAPGPGAGTGRPGPPGMPGAAGCAGGWVPDGPVGGAGLPGPGAEAPGSPSAPPPAALPAPPATLPPATRSAPPLAQPSALPAAPAPPAAPQLRMP